MKKAIITGATGLIGTAVARHFSSLGIDTLCLGRQAVRPEDVSTHFGEGSRYLPLAMESIGSLGERIDSINWSPGPESVFFNFAWSGQGRLTDGSFGEQLNNAVYAAEAVRSARKLGCIKFVDSGTLEETLAEEFLEQGGDNAYPAAQANYALAKLASRDLCRMVAYLEKIDYVHTRLSVPLAPDLSRGTYVASTLKKIAERKPYEAPANTQLMDIVFIDDVARAYHLIGIGGKNKADYFIGTSRPATLQQLFQRFESLVANDAADEPVVAADSSSRFDTGTLYRDTGFVATTRLEDIVEVLRTP